MSLSANISLKVDVKEGETAGVGSVSSTVGYAKSISLINGIAAGMANKSFNDQRNLAASASDDLDLAGDLVDAFGNTITFASIKTMVFVASETNQGNLQIGAGSNAFATFFADTTDALILPPGGMFAITAPADGFAVTADTADVLTVENLDSVNAADYDVILIGLTA